MDLPLFITSDGQYKKATEIFSFDPQEGIHHPEIVYKLLSLPKSLFITPENINVGKYGIFVEREVYNKLFKKALTYNTFTEEILNYLDTVDYEYSERHISKNESYHFSIKQIENFFKHEKLSDILINIAVDCIKKNQRPPFIVDDINCVRLNEVLYEGFDITETPKIVESYLTYCNQTCFIADIPDNSYIPCRSGIVLPINSTLQAFASFCFKMDSNDTFAIRIKLNEASKQLDQYIEANEGSAADFLRVLKNIRLAVRDSLGKNEYKSYLDLILKSGTDHGRFIQELLQNADDCLYPEDSIPTFSLQTDNGILVTEYNENGFSRENIRSITAIGESTKTRLLEGDYRTIGEKGVGFKTVFATASEVKIYSGDYNFSLTSERPTIPNIISMPSSKNQGTRMEIFLKDKSIMPHYKEQDILDLCLCLRKLKNISINGIKITIHDTDTLRTITIDKKTYSFKRYIHSFIVSDQKAISEREYGSRKISPNQKIVCYVPEKSIANNYPLYVGLPTKHRIKIPIVIDAPFELTTSREEIETGCADWNNIVRKEMYNAIIQVIHSRKIEERIGVLRFARFTRQFAGNQSFAYFNDVSDSDYLNKYNYLELLMNESILPTFDNEIFVSASDPRCFRYPEAVMFLMREIGSDNFGKAKPECALDINTEGLSKELRDRITAVLNAISCKNASFDLAFQIIRENAESFMHNQEFRGLLYEYLTNTPDIYKNSVAQLKIIPVYTTNGGTQFIKWDKDNIFVKKDSRFSSESYWILNEVILSKTTCESMLGININEMNEAWERSRYNDALKQKIQQSNGDTLYSYLISEFNNGNLRKNDSIGILFAFKHLIPLKNQIGEVTVRRMFTCDQPIGYFSVQSIQSLIVNKECTEFAKYLGLDELSGIHFEDFNYTEQLTDDDIESILDDYFLNSDEILRGFYRSGLLSDELLAEYDLQYLAFGIVLDDAEYNDFPEMPVGNRESLIAHIKKMWKSPSRVISVKEERTVHKIQNANGEVFSINSNDSRNGALQTYAVGTSYKRCFCQMCKKDKPQHLIEVNNIEKEPKYYFPQLRISLCLECSKQFEYLRNNEKIRLAFLSDIKNAIITYQGKIEVPIGKYDSITFTGKHLFEIQEILKRIPKH